MNLIAWFSKHWNAGTELAKARAAQRLEYERRIYAEGVRYLSSLSKCPRCGNEPNDSLIAWVQDGMGVRGNHCDHEIHLLQWFNKPDFMEMHELAKRAVYRAGLSSVSRLIGGGKSDERKTAR